MPQDFERDEERSANGGSESDGEENIGWSTVNLDEEKQQQDVRAAPLAGGHGGGAQTRDEHWAQCPEPQPPLPEWALQTSQGDLRSK